MSTETKSSKLGGRGLFATRTFKAGDEVLLLDRPLIAVLDKPRVEDTCSFCFAWTELPVLSGAGVNQATKVNWCSGCKKVKYCSKQCQSRAWKAGHKRECKAFAAHEELIPNIVVAVMQMIQGINSGDAEYKPILDMEAHRDEFAKGGGAKWEAMQLMSHTALKLAGQSESQLDSAKMAMCILMCNSSRLVTPTFDPLGLILDPRTAVINHSCSPNAIVTFDGPRLSFRCLDPISKGNEILISYIDSTAPFGVRQAELKDQYFFTCKCAKCSSGMKAPQDAFLKPGPDFEDRIRVIDENIPQIEKDTAWERHILGTSTHEKRLSALQFYAYSYLDSPDAESAARDVTRFRKAIMIIRNTRVYPLTRAPLPALYQQYAVASLGAKRYNEALIAMLRLYVLIDQKIYSQKHHPVRIVHAWTLATLAKAVGSDQDSPFCKALQSCGVDLSILFIALLTEIHEQVPKSHGAQSQFGQMVRSAWESMMQNGGELDTQYSQMGVRNWRKLVKDQIDDMWPKLNAFAEDDDIAAQIDQALTAPTGFEIDGT